MNFTYLFSSLRINSIMSCNILILKLLRPQQSWHSKIKKNNFFVKLSLTTNKNKTKIDCLSQLKNRSSLK